MVQMDPAVAVLALLAMAGFYWLTRFTPAGESGGDITDLLRRVMTQLTPPTHLRLQRKAGQDPPAGARAS